MRRSFHPDEVDDNLIRYARFRIAPKGDEFNLQLTCCTDATTMKQTALYEDEVGRVYRPRIDLTEIINNQLTRETTSERYIYFDCYLLPAFFGKKNKNRDERDLFYRPVNQITEKARPPSSGEMLKMHLRKDRKSDDVSVKRFEGVIEEIYWGTLTVQDEDKNLQSHVSDNLGLVLVRVRGSYPRSLVLETEFDRRKRKIPLAF